MQQGLHFRPQTRVSRVLEACLGRENQVLVHFTPGAVHEVESRPSHAIVLTASARVGACLWRGNWGNCGAACASLHTRSSSMELLLCPEPKEKEKGELG